MPVDGHRVAVVGVEVLRVVGAGALADLALLRAHDVDAVLEAAEVEARAPRPGRSSRK